MIFSKRPWGWWAVLWQWPLFNKGPRYKLKLLYFGEGGAISKQRHSLRSEKWKIIFGHGRMKTGDPFIRCPWSEKYSISAGVWHQYLAWTPTLVLETQRGTCMESDIERV